MLPKKAPPLSDAIAKSRATAKAAGGVEDVDKRGPNRKVYTLPANKRQIDLFSLPVHIPDDWDAGINRGLGIPDGMIHFAYVNPNYKVRLSPAVLVAAARDALQAT